MSFSLNLAPQHRVYAGFATYSFAMGNIFPRLPDIKHAMGIADGTLGLSLIGTPIGTLTALTLATPLLERIGFRRALLTLVPLLALLYAIAVHAPEPVALFLMLFPIGLMIGSVEIILNVEADRTEFHLKRRIMNRAHSFWSAGFFGAGLFGGAMAHLGLSPQLHLALVVPIVAISMAIFLGGYEPAPARFAATGDKAPMFARPTLPILVLVAVTLSAMLLEGASIDWSAIYMRTVFESGPFVAGFTVALFAFSQATTRFFADSFVDRHSPSGVARVLLVTTAAGVFLVFFSPAPFVSMLGFALLGVGSSAIFPLAISAAAQRSDRPAAINVAALSQISFTAFLLGPPLLGFVSDHWGIRSAFGIGIPFIILSLLTVGSLGARRSSSATSASAGSSGTREEALARANEA
ncbi:MULTISPECIES: MFS transporter [unclassified Mesorhizobium]|uniref:MFS transporter n=1 Tax=unclassified Mesorhizobium TaxID=325217 RepID=UPI000FD82970|nr:MULTISPECIES: MFS transporter [unclassified Mesorhizobium]TGR58492.1 MFS transporter [bacterium M00.F.Ca.ET.199.01.1.1]TGU41396.1 MFS transporter [bacterium M00.F.Ca.ET.156.01.1.1]TGV90355.1 MFS transporter [Mesorhizobium sp. M00.F.Ca.ET.149.01.1.1]TGR33239.1 MFS transporter [Mesorhizobium sp. M8A.F.Ca.ET.197.01.1.1]TGR34883.1 MFS transporter [Mesorhizobium sp. M8A.F.Ca.ET.202.01.1.1]